MSEFRKTNTDYPYFLTISIAGWVDIFTRHCYSDIVIDSLKFCCEKKGLELFAYLIMPSHLHLIARHDDARLNSVIRDFKSFTARKIMKAVQVEPSESRRNWMMRLFRYYGKYRQGQDYAFWQPTNHPKELNQPGIIDQKIEYIHLNPVKAGYVTLPEHWYGTTAALARKAH
ncbi:MAG: transposase [Bacteroidia bacterium]